MSFFLLLNLAACSGSDDDPDPDAGVSDVGDDGDEDSGVDPEDTGTEDTGAEETGPEDTGTGDADVPVDPDIDILDPIYTIYLHELCRYDNSFTQWCYNIYDDSYEMMMLRWVGIDDAGIKYVRMRAWEDEDDVYMGELPDRYEFCTIDGEGEEEWCIDANGPDL